jgi:hypothetical protein
MKLSDPSHKYITDVTLSGATLPTLFPATNSTYPLAMTLTFNESGGTEKADETFAINCNDSSNNELASFGVHVKANVDGEDTVTSEAANIDNMAAYTYNTCTTNSGSKFVVMCREVRSKMVAIFSIVSHQCPMKKAVID